MIPYQAAAATVTAGQVAPSDALIKVEAASAVSPRVLRLISISLCSTRVRTAAVYSRVSLWVTLYFSFIAVCLPPGA